MHPQHRKDLPIKAAERHQLRRRSFDAGAWLYDKFRPGYPEPLFEDLVQLSGIPEGGRILEIGPGTGQATLPLARRGFSILGLELGASMARLCRRNCRGFPNVEILNAAFEDWKPAEDGDCTAPSRAKTGTVRGKQGLSRAEFDASAPRDCPSLSTHPGTVPGFPQGLVADAPMTFDMVLAATAFHWIPYKVAYPRCARALKSHGSLALLWNFVDTPDNRFYHDLHEIYHRIVPRARLSLPPELRIERQRKKIVNSGLFGPVTVMRYPWQKEYTADRYIGLLKTMSDHAIFAPQVRRGLFRAIRRLIDDNGGSFIRPVVAVLFLAPKRQR
jgi:SAM-dependent methyltransferase